MGQASAECLFGESLSEKKWVRPTIENHEKYVSSTGRTEVETVEAPSQLKLTENIMAYNMEENGLSLIIDDGEVYPAYRISLNNIATFLNCEGNDIEEASFNKLPLKASITVQHDEITQNSLKKTQSFSSDPKRTMSLISSG